MWALKYRPRRFEDLIGQEHCVKVLRTIIERRRIPAGFIFSGVRGTGKTTSARVVASVLNCESIDEGCTTACLRCDSCLSVEVSNCPFVHEIDAASNNSINDIRGIKTSALYGHAGKYRIYILDEVHSLSEEAFQALLKTLEEPPPAVLFILATTDLDAVPDTVLSRLMQFDFKRMTPDLIAMRLQYIAAQESVSISDTRIFNAIAELSGGAMRDAIMRFEQLVYYKDNLTLADFNSYYGLVSADVYGSLIHSARSANVLDAKKTITDNFARGVDVAYFLDVFMRCVGDDVSNRVLTNEQAIAIYRAAVEVKTRLKYLSSDVAMSFLFTLLLKVFHEDKVTSSSAAASVADITSLLGE